MSENWQTGDLVLCRVGAFSPWPAVVVPEAVLADEILKRKKPNTLAVCFFNDPTYFWALPQKLKRLDKRTIDHFVRTGYKTATNEDLIIAYQQAKDYQDLRAFVRKRLASEKRLRLLSDYERDKGPLTAGQDPTRPKDDITKRKSHTSPTHNSKKVKTVTKPKRRPEKGKTTKRVKEDDTQAEFAEKNRDKEDTKKFIKGEDKIAKTNSRSISDIKLSQDKKSSKLRVEERSRLDFSRRIEICNLFRQRIQLNLIQRDSPPSDIEKQQSHRILEKIKENLNNDPQFFDLKALESSELHKVLRVIIKSADLQEFHTISKDILSAWTPILSNRASL